MSGAPGAGERNSKALFVWPAVGSLLSWWLASRERAELLELAGLSGELWTEFKLLVPANYEVRL